MGQRDLVLLGQQRMPPHLMQVQPKQSVLSRSLIVLVSPVVGGGGKAPMHAAAGPLVLVACWEDHAAAARCRYDQHPLWLPDTSNSAVPASRNRGLTLATVRRDRLHAMRRAR